eukprot:NODE_279_length_11907_cov_0.265244.p8 type:complete len:129 gc:universal NODE_279_length_11907_cov_0.265244:8342-8728(+)
MTSFSVRLIAMFLTQLIGAVLYNPSVLGTIYYKALKLKPRQISVFEWIMVTGTAWLQVNAIDYVLYTKNPHSLSIALYNSFIVFSLFIVPSQAVHFPFDQRSYPVLFIYLLHHAIVFAANTIVLFCLK